MGRLLSGMDNIASAILAHAPDAIGVVEAAHDGWAFVYANAAFGRLYVCDPNAIVGMNLRAFMAQRSPPEDVERIQEQLGAGRPFEVMRQLLRPDAGPVWIEVRFEPLDVSGERWVFFGRDVTARKRERDLGGQFGIAIEQGRDPVAISVAVENQWQFNYVNASFVLATGLAPAEVIGQSWNVLFADSSVQRAMLVDVQAALHSGQVVRAEVPVVRKDGRESFFEMTAQPMRDLPDGPYRSVVATFRDITEKRRREETLLYEAEHDTVTGLYNRRHFERLLSTMIMMTRGAQATHALISIDLDHFKQVNDEYGHAIGDHVLKLAARAFRSALFEGDVLARWGGDEFAAVLMHCNLKCARQVAEQMRRALEMVPERHGVTASIGVVPIIGNESITETMHRADQATYLAKEAGRNCVVVEG